MIPGSNIVQSLVQKRIDRGLTQTQVAAAMCVCPSSVSHFEGGRHIARLDTLARYATAIGVELAVVDKPAEVAP